MRILVCGGRTYEDRSLVFNTLNTLTGVTDETLMPPLDTVIIHGGAGKLVTHPVRKLIGADLIARDWAICNWVRHEEYPPDWDTHGKAAGPIRNQRMIDEGKPDLVVAFPGGPGTADMVQRAEKAGIRIVRIT